MKKPHEMTYDEIWWAWYERHKHLELAEARRIHNKWKALGKWVSST